MTTPEWTERRLKIERGWVEELGLGLRRLRPENGTPIATLLYVHGLGESGLTLERLISDPQLADYDHVVPDLPGYGRSAWPDEPCNLHAHAQALWDLIHVLDLPRVVLVGHSMGGVIGLYLAETSPTRLRGFLNVEGNVTIDDCGFSSRAAEYDQDAWLAGRWRDFVERLHDEASADSEEAPSVLRAYGASIHHADPRTLLRNCRDLVDVSKEDVLAERFGALPREKNVPHLYLHGSRGTGLRSLDRLREAGVAIVRVDGAGHWPFVDHPDVTAGLLREFVEGLA